MRVLISRLSAMGDVVCSLPVATAFKASFPDCHVTWAVSPAFAPLVERCRAVDHVVKVKPTLSTAREQWDAIRAMDPFDLALDVQGLTKSAFVVAAARAKRRLGYHWQRELAPFFSQKVRPDPTSVHVVDQYVDVARAAGCSCDRAVFGLAPTDEDLTNARRLVGAGPYAVVHPGGGWASKRWAPENVREVCRTLTQRGVRPVLIGTKAEEQAEREVGPDAALSLVGKTDLGTLVGLVAGCHLHVGGDTGSTHLAAALGRPCVGLYLVTRPERSSPYGQAMRCPEPRLEEVIRLMESLT